MVDGKHVPPIVLGYIAKHFDLRNPGVIDEYVHLSESGFCLCKQRFDRALIADIRAYAENFRAILLQCLRKGQRLLFARAVVETRL